MKGRWLIASGAFVSMSFNGMMRTVLGAALPAIRSSLQLNLVQAGTLTAFLQLGFSVAVFVGGPLSDLIKKSRLLMLGCLLMGIHLILFGFSTAFGLSLIVIGWVGIGGGLIESSSNPLLIQLFPGRESTVMNLHHFFFAAGSLVGPLIVGAVLANQISWKWAYWGFGIFVLLIFFFYIFVFGRLPSPAGGGGFEKKLFVRLLRERVFLTVFFLTFLANGVQNGVAYWTVTFLKETKGFPIALAGATLSLFFACLAVGRLLTSYLITKFQDAVYLLGLFTLVLITLVGAAIAPGKWAIPFLGACGLVQAGVFPSLLAMTGKIYPNTPGTAMGLAATGAGLGAMTVPWLMSLIAQLTDLRIGFFSFGAFIFLSIVLMSLNLRTLSLATHPPS